MPIILPYKGKTPKIDPSAYIADNAVVIGDVEIGANASIWFGCVVRGDVNYIRIGEGTNVQDGTVIHVHRNQGPTIIGKGVTIGHMALLHACTLEDYSFVGMGAKIIDYSTVKTNAMVAAGGVLAPRKVVETGQLWAGVPAKYFRDMNQDELDWIKISEQNYIKLAGEYKANA